MADDERFAASLQQLVLAALCFDGEYGAAIAAQVKPDYFDNIYRDFVTRVLLYRKRHNKPPGPNYLEDLAVQAAPGRDNKLIQQRLVPVLLAEQDGLNAEYIASRVHIFVHKQIIKSSIMEATTRYGNDDERMPQDIERIFQRALQFHHNTFDAGIFLNDPKGLKFVDQQEQFTSLGIPELDRRGIGLIPKELLLYIAAKSTGKSWFCVHVGKQALLQRQKVVHYTLEMDELKVLRRYYQALFGVARKADRVPQTLFEFDELDRLVGFKTRHIRPKLDFSNPKIRALLRDKMASFGTRLGGLLIKSFPTSSLTLAQLISHLDYLESVEQFVPNVMIVDYPKLMDIDKRDLRVSLGRTVEELRGLAVSRNLALVAPHQGSRASLDARFVTSSMASEDISVVQTADTVLAYMRTRAEKQYNLGRLSIEHARDNEDGGIIVLSQSYETGQYVISSAVQQRAYWDRLKTLGGEGEEE